MCMIDCRLPQMPEVTMTTPEALWYTDGIAVPTDTPAPGAVKYIRADLAGWPEPRPIETAPKDKTWILGWIPSIDWWAILQWDLGEWHDDDGDWPYGPTHWLPLPPAPGEVSKT